MHPVFYKGAHKTVILKITIMASVRRDWERNNGYPVKAGYPLFFLPPLKAIDLFTAFRYNCLKSILSHPFRDFSKKLKKVWKHWNNSVLLMPYIVEG
jgi:hypothetical protein